MALTGEDVVTRNLQAAIEKLRAGAEKGLRSEADRLLANAQERCPVKTGTLRRSGHVGALTEEGGNLTASIGFGGPAASYALPVHERTEVRHPVGEAKFLERAADEAAGSFASNVAAAIRSELGT
jgi:hypothetical protein